MGVSVFCTSCMLAISFPLLMVCALLPDRAGTRKSCLSHKRVQAQCHLRAYADPHDTGAWLMVHILLQSV